MSIEFPDGVVTFDIESHSVDEMGTMPPEKYFRLGQWAWGEGPVHTTTDLATFRRVILGARMLIGANILSFDLPAIFGDTLVGVKLARQGRVLDTHVFALTANPPPFGSFVNRKGIKQICTDPPHFRKWISLDNQAFQLGLEGKTADLTELTDKYAYTHEPVLTKTGKVSMTTDKTTGEKIPRTRKIAIEDICCRYGAIPVDDQEFVRYAERDVTVVREVARKLLERHPYDAYTRREMLKVACAVQIGRGNGFTVDIPATRQRAKDLHEEAAHVLNWLRDTYDFPVTGKKPLASKDGKAALLQALEDAGVPESALPRTEPTDLHPEGQPSFSAENILAATSRAPKSPGKRPFHIAMAKELGEAVATLAGQRSLAELLLAEVKPDGKVHPEIFPLQRSGRFSTTKPGLTIWSPDFRDLLVADSTDEVLVEFDFAAADARAVAAMSGDTEFAKRFGDEIDPELLEQLRGYPDILGLFRDDDGNLRADAHTMTALTAWGVDKVATDPKGLRQKAKAPGHGWGYKMGAKKMAESTGLSVEECKAIINSLNSEYPGVVAWQERVTKRAQRYGYVVNQWGRRMAVEPGREFTQTPALFGQGATHELLCDGLMRLDDQHLRMVKITVHDAFTASIPRATLEEDIAYFLDKFTTTWHPNGGQAIDFPLGHGTPAYDWKGAAH